MSGRYTHRGREWLQQGQLAVRQHLKYILEILAHAVQKEIRSEGRERTFFGLLKTITSLRLSSFPVALLHNREDKCLNCMLMQTMDK